MADTLSPTGHGRADGSRYAEEEESDEEDEVQPVSPAVPAPVGKDEATLLFPGALASEKMTAPLKESPDGRTLSSSEEEGDEQPPCYEREDSRGVIIPDEPLIIPDEPLIIPGKPLIIPDESPVSPFTGAGQPVQPMGGSGVIAEPSSLGGQSSEEEDEGDLCRAAHLSPDEAKKRGLSFDYTEPQPRDGQVFHAGRQNGSDKESRSPDSCRADPGSPFSPCTAPEQEVNPRAENKTRVQEEDEDEQDLEDEVEAETVPQVEKFCELEKPEEPASAAQVTPEKYLESRGEDLIASASVAQVTQVAPVTDAAQAARPNASAKDAKVAEPPRVPADASRKPQKALPAATAPPPRAGAKFPKSPPAGAPASRKPNVPAVQSKGLSSVLFISPLSLSLLLSQTYIPPHSPAPLNRSTGLG